MLVKQHANKYTQILLEYFTQVTHNKNIICGNSSVHMQSGNQCQHVILNIV